MKRWNSMVITILFLLFLFGIAAAGLLLPDRKFSQLENRYLKLQPDWSLHRMMNGLWMDEMEDYLSDQIAGRDLWICLQGWSERLSGKKENNGVYFGKKDTLISRVEEPNERLLFQNVDYVNSLAEQAGVPVSFGLIPTKAAIWADRLPDDAPTADEYVWIQKAYGKSNVQNLDFYQALYSHGEEPVFIGPIITGPVWELFTERIQYEKPGDFPVSGRRIIGRCRYRILFAEATGLRRRPCGQHRIPWNDMFPMKAFL